MVDNMAACIGDVNPSTCVSNTFILVLRIFKGAGSVIGTFGALMTITAVVTHRSLRTVPNAYLVNLAIADLIVCSFLLPISMYTLSHMPNDVFCQLVGYPNMLCMMVSVLSLSAVAVNRYVVICRSRELYARMYTPRNTALSIIGVWILCCIIFSPPFYGFGEYGYNLKFGACIFMSGDVETYWFVFAMADCIVMFPTLPLTLFCYVNIMMKFHGSRRKVAGMGESVTKGQKTIANTPSTQDPGSDPSLNPENGSVTMQRTGTSTNLQAFQKTKERESSRKTRAVIKNMFLIWCAFLILWMPLVISYKIDYHGTYPNEIYHVLFCVAQCNSAVNFFIYCAFNKNFRDAYIGILTGKVFRK